MDAIDNGTINYAHRSDEISYLNEQHEQRQEQRIEFIGIVLMLFLGSLVASFVGLRRAARERARLPIGCRGAHPRGAPPPPFPWGEEGREGRGEGGGIKSRRTSFCPRYDVTFCASVHRHRRRSDALRQDAIHLSATGTRRRYG